MNTEFKNSHAGLNHDSNKTKQSLRPFESNNCSEVLTRCRGRSPITRHMRRYANGTRGTILVTVTGRSGPTTGRAGATPWTRAMWGRYARRRRARGARQRLQLARLGAISAPKGGLGREEPWQEVAADRERWKQLEADFFTRVLRKWRPATELAHGRLFAALNASNAACTCESPLALELTPDQKLIRRTAATRCKNKKMRYELGALQARRCRASGPRVADAGGRRWQAYVCYEHGGKGRCGRDQHRGTGSKGYECKRFATTGSQMGSCQESVENNRHDDHSTTNQASMQERRSAGPCQVAGDITDCTKENSAGLQHRI